RATAARERARRARMLQFPFERVGRTAEHRPGYARRPPGQSGWPALHRAPRVKPCASFELTAANFERAPCLDLYAGRDAALSTAFPGHRGRRVDGGRERTDCRVRRRGGSAGHVGTRGGGSSNTAAGDRTCGVGFASHGRARGKAPAIRPGVAILRGRRGVVTVGRGVTFGKTPGITRGGGQTDVPTVPAAPSSQPICWPAPGDGAAPLRYVAAREHPARRGHPTRRL